MSRLGATSGITGGLLAVCMAVFATTDARADTADAPLDGAIGDAARGMAIVRDRASGNCLICHRVPLADEPFQGDVGPDLTGVGSRLTAGQLRYRLIDQSRINPATAMPPYYRIDGLMRVAERFAGRPALDAQQIEDVVAWLATLRDDAPGHGPSPPVREQER